jgi:hypothetical protein
LGIDKTLTDNIFRGIKETVQELKTKIGNSKRIGVRIKKGHW